MKNTKESLYLRSHIRKYRSDRSTYYRLDLLFKEFLNKIEREGNEIVGIELERKENGEIGFNMGFILGKLKKENQIENNEERM